MVAIVALLGVAGAIAYWVIRAHGTVRALGDVNRDTKGLQRRAQSTLWDIFGTPLARVRDVRLAAVILMIQIVRTGSPVTASEKTKILEFMESPLRIEAISATFERAWTYTRARRPFLLAAHELLPLLRDDLTRAERRHLLDMLAQIAGAHSAASTLQCEAIAQFGQRLLDDGQALGAGRP